MVIVTLIKNVGKPTFIFTDFLHFILPFTSFWTYWIKKINPKKVLEIGIGNGRLIKLLSNTVLQYDGLDISKNIIHDFLKNNSWYKGNLFNQDMKNINLNTIYDLIILPFNTFCYLYTLDDLKLFFTGIKKISNDNTIIVIDIINPKINDIVDHKKYKLCGCLTINNNMCKLYEKHHYDYATQVVNYSKKYVLPNGIIKKFNLPVRIFFHQELINLFNLFDFEIINMLGDYNNENYNFDSRKQIVFIKKRSDKK